MYEAYGGRCSVQLKAAPSLPVREPEAVNLLEEPISDADGFERVDARTVSLDFKPFQIRTVKFAFHALAGSARSSSASAAFKLTPPGPGEINARKEPKKGLNPFTTSHQMYMSGGTSIPSLEI